MYQYRRFNNKNGFFQKPVFSKPVKKKHVFSKNQLEAFCKYTVSGGVDMLTKRSTPVDQIFGSESICSKLSVAIFIASRNHLEA